MLKTDSDFEENLPPVVLPDKRNRQIRSVQYRPRPKREDDAFDSLLRLIIGLMLEGRTELDRRLEKWEQDVQRQAYQPAENTMEHMRYTVIGLIFEGRDFIESRLNDLEKRANNTQSLLQNVLKPLMNNPIAQRVQRHIDNLFDNSNRLVRRGQREEYRSRQIAKLAYSDLIDDFLDYLSRNPEVNEMIRKQSADLASSVLSNARDVTISADDKVEAIARALLGRRPRRNLAVNDQRVEYTLRGSQDDTDSITPG
jgi:hypothetical protein